MVGAERRRRGYYLWVPKTGISGSDKVFRLAEVAKRNRCMSDGMPTAIAEYLLKGLRKSIRPGTMEKFVKTTQKPMGTTIMIHDMRPDELTKHGIMERIMSRERKGAKKAGLQPGDTFNTYTRTRYKTTMLGAQLLLLWAARSPEFKRYVEAYLPDGWAAALEAQEVSRALGIGNVRDG
jgi:hypothetical protein